MQKLTNTQERILSEDALKHIYKWEQKGRRPTIESIAGVLQVTLDEAAGLLEKMTACSLLTLEGRTLSLTPAGQKYAVQVIRAHRLWERYLADETGFPETEWHERADRQEHRLSPAEANRLAARLGHPTHDPHGDPIPTANGHWTPHGGQPLTSLVEGQPARIVHLEDEPPVVYAQLVAEELYPGMELRVTQLSPQRIRFRRRDGSEHVLAPIVAANISVVPISEDEVAEAAPTRRLSDLKPGQQGKVVTISPTCRGPERRRFMDLGILPGTVITAEMKSPGGDPTAYRIRDALIALRREQANLIHIDSPLAQEEGWAKLT